MAAMEVEYDAIILAGGRARRLGGIDKTLIEIGGRSLLGTAVAAADRARSTVVVGPERPGFAGVVFLLEQPPQSGPVHALSAGLEVGSAPLVAVLAADLPFVTAAIVERLAAAVGDADGAIAVDVSGRDQYMLAVYRRSAIEASLQELQPAAGAPMADAVRSLRLVRVGEESATSDCDTPQDVTAARRLTEERLTEEENSVRGVD
jgi:molybdopterin-guanine dinucleotide biosynthesis protein A